MANLFQIERCEKKAGSLVPILEGVASRHAPKVHGGLLKDVRMWIHVSKGLEGSTNDLLNEPFLADFAKPATKFAHGQGVQIGCHLGEKLDKLGAPSDKVEGFGGLKLDV
jgi:hypothetical protein